MNTHIDKLMLQVLHHQIFVKHFFSPDLEWEDSGLDFLCCYMCTLSLVAEIRIKKFKIRTCSSMTNLLHRDDTETFLLVKLQENLCESLCLIVFLWTGEDVSVNWIVGGWYGYSDGTQLLHTRYWGGDFLNKEIHRTGWIIQFAKVGPCVQIIFQWNKYLI